LNILTDLDEFLSRRRPSGQDYPHYTTSLRHCQRRAASARVVAALDGARTHLAIRASQNSVIQDRSIYEDAHIFARALHDMKMLNLRDYRAYRELYDLVIGTLPPPDLLVYLQASVPTLMERIGKRGRGMESGITADYLERLGALYTEWINDFNLCPVLTVPADDLDFVKHETHLQIISDRILDKLQGKEEVVFPKM
jgi:deoxyadenosine/deoxycytidine kinase